MHLIILPDGTVDGKCFKYRIQFVVWIGGNLHPSSTATQITEKAILEFHCHSNLSRISIGFCGCAGLGLQGAESRQQEGDAGDPEADVRFLQPEPADGRHGPLRQRQEHVDGCPGWPQDPG